MASLSLANASSHGSGRGVWLVGDTGTGPPDLFGVNKPDRVAPASACRNESLPTSSLRFTRSEQP